MTAKKPVVPSIARMLRDIVTPDGFDRKIRNEPKTEWQPAYKVLELTSDEQGIAIEICFTGGRDAYELATGHVSFDTSAGRRSFDRYGVEDSFYIDNPLKWGNNDRFWTHERVIGPDGLGTIIEAAGYKGNGAERYLSNETHIAWDNGTTKTYSGGTLKRRKIKKADVIEQTNYRIKRFIEVKIPEARAKIDISEKVPGIPFLVTPERKAEVTRALKAKRNYAFHPSGFGTGYQLWGSKNRDRYAKRATPEMEEFFGVWPIYISTFDAD